MPEMKVSLQRNCMLEEDLQSEEKLYLPAPFRHLLNPYVEEKLVVQDQSTDKLDPEVFRALALARSKKW